MPLGIARLNTLSRYIVEEAAAGSSYSWEDYDGSGDSSTITLFQSAYTGGTEGENNALIATLLSPTRLLLGWVDIQANAGASGYDRINLRLMSFDESTDSFTTLDTDYIDTGSYGASNRYFNSTRLSDTTAVVAAGATSKMFAVDCSGDTISIGSIFTTTASIGYGNTFILMDSSTKTFVSANNTINSGTDSIGLYSVSGTTITEHDTIGQTGVWTNISTGSNKAYYNKLDNSNFSIMVAQDSGNIDIATISTSGNSLSLVGSWNNEYATQSTFTYDLNNNTSTYQNEEFSSNNNIMSARSVITDANGSAKPGFWVGTIDNTGTASNSTSNLENEILVIEPSYLATSNYTGGGYGTVANPYIIQMDANTWVFTFTNYSGYTDEQYVELGVITSSSGSGAPQESTGSGYSRQTIYTKPQGDFRFHFDNERLLRYDENTVLWIGHAGGDNTNVDYGNIICKVVRAKETVSGGAGAVTYRADSYSSNLVLAMPFDHYNGIADVSADIRGSGTNLTVSAGGNSTITGSQVYWSSPNYARSLENTDTASQDAIQVTLNTGIPSSSSNTDYVVEGWFKANNSTANGNWTLSSGDVNGRWLLGVNNGTTYTISFENMLGIGSNWAHIAIVQTSGTRYVYVNGVYKGSFYSTNTGFTTLHIGQFRAGEPNDFQGHIQDLRVYVGTNKGYTGTNTSSANFTLPQSMIDTLPAITLSRPYSITTVGNAEVDTAVTKYGTGTLLPQGGKLEAEMDMPSGDFTIEGWYRITNRSAPSGMWEIKDDTNSSRLALYGGEAGGGFKVLYLTYSDSSGTEQIDIVTPTGTFPDTTWKHCAVTKNGDTFTVWIDGVNRGSATYSSFVMPSTTTLGIGGSITDNRYFRGNVDEFRVSDTARYTTGFTAPTGEHSSDSNTLLLVHMNGADGSTSFTDDNT